MRHTRQPCPSKIQYDLGGAGDPRLKDRTAEAVFHGRCPKGFPADLFRTTRRKLGYLDAANSLSALNAPPGNRLEALVGDRLGQHSIRVNDQFRICFVWTMAGPVDVAFIDYH